MPPGYEPLIEERYHQGTAEIWAPLAYELGLPYACRSCQHLRAFAKLKPGVTPAQATAEMNSIREQMRTEFPTDYETGQMAVVPLASGADRRRADRLVRAARRGRVRAAHRLRERRQPAAVAIGDAAAGAEAARGARRGPRAHPAAVADRERDAQRRRRRRGDCAGVAERAGPDGARARDAAASRPRRARRPRAGVHGGAGDRHQPAVRPLSGAARRGGRSRPRAGDRLARQRRRRIASPRRRWSSRIWSSRSCSSPAPG